MLPLNSPFLAACVQAFEKYIFNDWSALAFLFVPWLIDTVLGMMRSFKQGRFHSRGMRQMFIKLREYAVAIVIAHVFCNLEINGQKLPWEHFVSTGIKGVIYLAILIVETKSIDENLRGLGGRGLPLPRFLRQGMTDWEETGQFRSKVPPEELAPAPVLAADPIPLPASPPEFSI